MDGLDIFNVYIMGSIEMLTVFHFFTRFLKKKVKFIYYILFVFLGMTIMMFFPTGRDICFFVGNGRIDGGGE